MNVPFLLRLFLFCAGLLAAVIGAWLAADPASFHALHGVRILTEASSLTEVRAPGGALLALGLVVMLGAFVPNLAFTATLACAALYLGYGLARAWSLRVDGRPHEDLVVAMAAELIIGAIAALALLRWRPRASAFEAPPRRERAEGPAGYERKCSRRRSPGGRCHRGFGAPRTPEPAVPARD